MNWREFVEAEKERHPVTDLCRVMKVSRAAYYRKHGETQRSQDDDRLAGLMRASHKARRKGLGARGHVAELAAAGERCSRRRARRLMRREQLVSVHTRLYVPTTTIRGISSAIPDLVKRDFFAAQPNALFVGDIMYVPTEEGWMYLCLLLDVFDRSVAGWALEDHLRTELCTAALDMVIRSRDPKPGAIDHSDRGCQFTSADYAAVVRKAGMVQSMGRTGVCWDNAMAESLNGTFRKELLCQNWTTKAALRREMPGLVAYYNQGRRHSRLGYLTPEEFLWCHEGQFTGLTP
jgi:transposase InsO family protein